MKLPYLKKVNVVTKMPIPNNPHDIQMFNGLAQFYQCYVKKISFIMAPITTFMQKLKEFIWTRIAKKHGDHQMQVCGGSNFNCSHLGEGIPCSHRCLQLGGAQNLDGKCDQPLAYAPWLLSLAK